MSKKLTTTKLKMAALGNNMIEAGAELYRDPEIKNKIKEVQNKNETSTGKEINTMLAYGSVGLGLNEVEDNETKSRLEKDIKGEKYE